MTHESLKKAIKWSILNSKNIKDLKPITTDNVTELKEELQAVIIATALAEKRNTKIPQLTNDIDKDTENMFNSLYPFFNLKDYMWN